jgi:integrase
MIRCLSIRHAGCVCLPAPGDANGSLLPMKLTGSSRRSSRDRALWATAIYAGLRHGELRALQVRDIDLERRRIEVQRGWDQYEGEIEPKSEKGTRPTIIAKPLHHFLAKHIQDTGREGADLVFGDTSTKPFQSDPVNKRARKAWATARKREDHQNTRPTEERIRPIGLQDCRHTAVSQMLHAGIAIDMVSKFMGHASITIDRYGHLLPEGEADAIVLLDDYHQRTESK